MTIAIALQLGDGVVLGADSASTMMTQSGVGNIYLNADKVFNFVKRLPIGAVIAGLGELAGRTGHWNSVITRMGAGCTALFMVWNQRDLPSW